MLPQVTWDEFKERVSEFLDSFDERKRAKTSRQNEGQNIKDFLFRDDTGRLDASDRERWRDLLPARIKNHVTFVEQVLSTVSAAALDRRF